jgi:signal transduction histidine kinase
VGVEKRSAVEIAISQNRLFRGVPEHLFPELASLAVECTAEEGEVLFDEGQVDDSLYVVADGAVRISRLGTGGRQLTLSHIRGGDFFGEMALVDGEPRSARATAVQDCKFLRMDRLAFREMIRLAPEVSQNLARSITERMRSVIDLRVDEAVRETRLSIVGSMTGTVVHDLKNPIGVVRSAADLLEDSIGDPIQIAGMLRRSADLMLGLVQDLLDYSRGTVTVRPQSFAMRDLVEDLEEQVLGRLEGRGVQVERRVAFEGDVALDRIAILRALLNVIKNAGEAMPDGGTLMFSVERQADEVVFTISDTGCGIPDDILPTIFEPFVTHGKAGGTGLGMATTKAVVEAHNGSIRVRSRIGEGTTFVMALPIRSD